MLSKNNLKIMNLSLSYIICFVVFISSNLCCQVDSLTKYLPVKIGINDSVFFQRSILKSGFYHLTESCIQDSITASTGFTLVANETGLSHLLKNLDKTGTGQLIEFYEDGSIKKISTIVNYYKNGRELSFYKNSKINCIRSFQKNMFVGEICTFDQNGNLLSTGGYVIKNIETEEDWKKYELVSSFNLNNQVSLKHGNFIYYCDERVIKTEVYDLGVLIKVTE